MRIRGRERYLSEEVDRWLRMIAAAHGGGLFTPDEVADHLLRGLMAQKCPQFLNFQKEVNKLSETFYEDIRKAFPLVIEPGIQPHIKA